MRSSLNCASDPHAPPRYTCTLPVDVPSRSSVSDRAPRAEVAGAHAMHVKRTRALPLPLTAMRGQGSRSRAILLGRAVTASPLSVPIGRASATPREVPRDDAWPAPSLCRHDDRSARCSRLLQGSTVVLHAIPCGCVVEPVLARTRAEEGASRAFVGCGRAGASAFRRGRWCCARGASSVAGRRTVGRCCGRWSTNSCGISAS